MGTIVYHGSTIEVRKPDIAYSKRFLDFGKGFYVTTFKEQAEKWALRKSLRNGGIAIVSVYELADGYAKDKVLTFSKDESWLGFVCACRKGSEVYKDYDLIFGNVADDDVFKTIDMYMRGVWDLKRTIEELSYYKLNNQFAFINQNFLEKYLFFKYSYEVNKL